MTPAELRERWLSEAEHLRPYNAGAAHAFEQAARDLEQLNAADSVSLTEAAKITGRTADHLGRMIRREQLPNVGRKHAPRIPRAALERFGRQRNNPATPLAPSTPAPYNPTADARSLLRRRAQGERHGP